MFIKRLIIFNTTTVFRDIQFTSGLNLIIDDTPIEDTRITGNNVGKTTVLKLIDFCLGAQGNIIYSDTENKKEIYDIVKDFLINEKVEIKLVLAENLDNPESRQLEIHRNFLTRKNAIRKINGKLIPEKEFERELERYIFPDKEVEKPSFRQIISHNIRYKDESLNNTLKTLDKYTTDIEYETLYLYLLGCTFNEGARKQALITKLNQESTFKKRLEQKQTKTTYEMALSLLDDEINALNRRKDSLNINENFEQDLEELNNIRYQMNRTSGLISKLEIRKSLIEESQQELKKSISNIDLQQLRMLYNETVAYLSDIQKTFEDLVAYHNNMVVEKVKYIVQELPDLIQQLEEEKKKLGLLTQRERELADKIAKGDSFEELEKIIEELTEKYKMKGEYESIISQLDDVEENIRSLNSEIGLIDDNLFSNNFELILKERVKKFNKYFSYISQELYGETYALTFSKETHKKSGQPFYKFNAFNANMSSGKKQGEILCFDLAYILFADEEHLSCLHFLLNDKKELMHDNQLVKVAEFIQHQNIQLIISILKDKLPAGVLDKAHVAVELTQKDKLFRIEV